MPGHFDLGHDRNVAISRIADDIPNLLLRVKAAVTNPIVTRLSFGMSNPRAVPPRRDFRQPRVFLYLNAPTLVIGQVPVENVQFMEREQIDELVDKSTGRK